MDMQPLVSDKPVLWATGVTPGEETAGMLHADTRERRVFTRYQSPASCWTLIPYTACLKLTEQGFTSFSEQRQQGVLARSAGRSPAGAGCSPAGAGCLSLHGIA
ncbi:MAG: hypothetical protein OXI96_03875 [Acidimicrobiaceae bacterium]|nr:hypothetical protein [Acidimicrobiaceae bacterium]